MASGTFNISTNNSYISGYVEWSEYNVNISNNTSSLSITVYLHRTNTYSGTPSQLNNVNLTRTFYVGSDTVSWTEPATITIPNNHDYVTVAYTTYADIPHNSDGSLTISLGFAMSNARSNAAFTVPAQYGTAVLTTIARTSVLNSASIDLPNNTIAWSSTKYSSSFWDNLIVYSGNTSFTISGIATSGSQTLTSAQLNTLYSIIGTSTSATVNAYIATYNNNVLIGASNIVAIPISLPSYSLQWNTHTCEDSITTFDTYKNDSTDLIVNLSQPTLTFSASSSTGNNYGRTIGYTLNNASVTSPITIANYTGQALTLKASDGRTAKDITWTAPNSVIPYQYPTIQCKVKRTSPTASTAAVTITGTYYDGDGLTNLENLYLDLTYQETGGTSTTITSFNINSSTSNHIVSYTATATLTGLDYTKAITYIANMRDLLFVAPPSANGTIPRGRPAWNAYYDSNGESNFNVYGFLKRNEDCFFPIGYVYISTDSTNPSTYFGGTWTKIGAGRCLMGASNDNELGTTVNSGLPNITGTVDPRWTDSTGGGIILYNQNNGALYTSRPDNHGYWWAGTTVSGGAGTNTQYHTRIEFDASRSNSIYGNSNIVQPPAIKVYFWERTA